MGLLDFLDTLLEHVGSYHMFQLCWQPSSDMLQLLCWQPLFIMVSIPSNVDSVP